MKKIYTILASALCLASCSEFEPVFTAKYDDPAAQEPVEMETNVTIADFTSLYDGAPLEIRNDYVFDGIVSTTDQPGNFYKSLYIQDETGGIELKIGRNSLYNEYKPGQRLYVSAKGLTLGMYGYKDNAKYGGNGMVSLGFNDPSGSYETSYMEVPLMIDTHVFKGPFVEEVTPVELTESQLPGRTATVSTNKYLGTLVTLKGLKYGKEVFCLLYLDSQLDKKSYTNRVFLSSSNVESTPTCGVTTWAMSKEKMTEYLLSGIWDAYKIGSGSNYVMVTDPETGEEREKTLGDMVGDGTYPDVEKAAYSVSQYFKMGSTDIQIRTSGYCKFCDAEIPQSVLDGTATIDVTGILTLYEGSIQFVVNSLDDIVVNE